ncbi:phospholipid-transporting ATPase ABCA3-like [Ornithodoros turicata]|uniref:phospholipid-transporting ATPase ABCA3-like n=1 Tax=Ornithodoros turicata TaxID=34597 RepID=UPI00313A191B
MGMLSQLSIFLWKNLYVQKVKRHYVLTAAELVVALAAFVMVERDRPLPPDNIPFPPYLAPASVYNQQREFILSKPRKVLYFPNTPDVQLLLMDAFPGIEIEGYANHDAMIAGYQTQAPKPDLGPDQNIITIQIDTSTNQTNLQYIIGFYDNTNFLSRRLKNNPVFEPLPDAVTQRVTTAFAQIAVNRAHRKMVQSRSKGVTAPSFEVAIQRLPEGPHPLESESRRSFMATRIGLAFILPFCVFITRLVKETHTGMKENMRLMGMRDFAYWMGYYLTAIIFGMIMSTLIIAYMSFVPYHNQRFLDGTSKTVVIVIFFLFCLQYGSLAMFLSLFFTSIPASIVFSFGFWLTSYVVPTGTLEVWHGYSAHYLLLSPRTKLVSSFFLPCMGPHWCFRIIGCANLVGEEYGWGSVFSPVLKRDNVSMIRIWIAMLTSTILQWVLLWYFGNVLPWAKGVPRSPWFLLSPRYWFVSGPGSYQPLEQALPDNVRFELDPPGVEAAVFVNRLELEKTQVFILHETTFKAFPGEITVVLGPTGSGKTALVRAITGMLVPASGQVIVCGFDMAQDTREARQKLGLSQKHDVLFDDLTVRETLRFFAVLRDIEGDVDARVAQILELVGLRDVWSTAVSNTLSLTNRRFLSVAIAIVAAPRVVVLDEPLYGLDTVDRRRLWGILQKVKATGPTSLIVTTSNVEAEMLGDRIAILGYGSLKCHGSRAFLHRRFGCGYNIRFTKLRKFQAKQCVDIAKSHVPEAYILSDHKDAQVVSLGEAAPPEKMAALLQRFEKDNVKLGIGHMCVFATTMEDVYIRLVLELEDRPERVRAGGKSVLMTRRGSRRMSLMTGFAGDLDLSGENVAIATNRFIAGVGSQEEYYESEVQVEAHVQELWELKPGRPGTLQVLKALLLKRLFYTRQSWALPLFCWLVPTAFMFWMCYFEKSRYGIVESSVEVSPDNIVYDLELVHPNAKVFVSYDINGMALAHNIYMPLVEEHTGQVTTREDINQFLDALSKETAPEMNFFLGARFTEDKQQKSGQAIAYYYGDAYHTEVSGRTRALLSYYDYSKCTKRDESWCEASGGDQLSYDVSLAMSGEQTEREPVGGYGVSICVMGGLHVERPSGKPGGEPRVATADGGTRTRRHLPQTMVLEVMHALFSIFQSLSLNLVHTALLRTVSGEPTSKVTAAFRPIRSDTVKEDSIRLIHNNRTKLLSHISAHRIIRFIVIPCATATLLASFVFFPIDERVTKAKSMQLLSGVSPLSYWMANYLWDLVLALVSMLCMFFPVFMCHPGTVAIMGHIVFLTLSYVHCMVPLVYYFSFVTDSMAAGFLELAALLSFSGITSTLGFQLLMIKTDEGVSLFAPVKRYPLLYLLYFVPPFSYHWSLVKVAQLTWENYICSTSALYELHDICTFIQASKDDGAVLLTGLRYCCGEFFRHNFTYLSTLGSLSFHRDSAAVELIILILEGIVFMMILVSVESGALKPLAGSKSGPSSPQQLNADVAEERRAVEKIVAEKDFEKAALIVNDIQKTYWRTPVLRGVSFLMRPGECLVVLGLRGSGKSTLLDVLAGTEPLNGGSAYMTDGTPLSDLEMWQQRIGVCPQYDGILGKLTVRQTLWLYANLRGIDSDRVEQLVSHVVELLNLRYYDTLYVSYCNASTRRKLAVGIAIIGLPPVVLMDDPAAGLDYFAKKKMYDTIRLIRTLVKAAVVVVTHSMSDCHAVSDRMALMVNGQFQSIGTIKEVRTRLCKGCQLSLRFFPAQLQDPLTVAHIDTTVRKWFPGAMLTAALHEQILEYSVVLTKSWSETFRSLNDLKAQLRAQDLLIGEATLEHVMLRSVRRMPTQPNVRV